MEFLDLYFAPNENSIIIDKTAKLTFLAGGVYPQTQSFFKLIFPFSFLRIAKIGQYVPDLMTENLHWKIYVNNELDINYGNITNVLGLIYAMEEIILFKNNAYCIEILALYDLAPIADTDLKVRIQGWATPNG